jgi:hypothetical protein
MKFASLLVSSLVLSLLLNFGIAQSHDKSDHSAPAAPASTAAASTAATAAAALDGAATDAASPTDTIPPGTSITMQNWQQYKQFMPEEW